MLTAHDMTERQWAESRGIDFKANSERELILDLYCEALATAEFAGIGEAVLDDLWHEARDRYSSEAVEST